MQSILEQAKKVQEQMETIKKEIASKTVEADAGGGMVKVVMSGNHQLRDVKIAQELIDSKDKEMIEDLVVAAVNKATQEASEMASSEMNKVSGMMPNIPGLNLNL